MSQTQGRRIGQGLSGSNQLNHQSGRGVVKRVNKEAATMTLPNPVEVPDPNIDDPVLPEPVPEQEPPPSTPPPNQTPIVDPPANAPPVTV
ncbi:hypothetical protein ALQ15_05532 [Pseudomonas syringae pv. actinidiae]|uniref:Uncharacterized protein n=2 Tax=Pseudomonas TaxID=286 RepID=A0A7Z6XY87_PSESF|nr:hypothetical protein ALQ15_05532 [Pseudomonas syringae pv. actinidiae]